MVITRILVVLALGACSLAAGCDPCVDGSMLDSDEGLVITIDEHPDGWGREECTTCHAYEALHRRGCTEGVDLVLVRETVEEDGMEACGVCHGENGLGEEPEVDEEEAR